MENILIVGANGTTGKKIVKLIESSQYFEPVAMVREKEQQNQFQKDGIRTVLGDLTEDLAHVVKNIDKVVFAAGSNGKNVVEVDQEGAKRLIDVSKMANINRFVMLSSMGADSPENLDELQDYMKAKQNADDHLQNSGLKYVIVRPGTLNDEKAAGKIKLQTKLNEMGEISRADVAQTLVRSLHDDAPVNVTFEILKGETLIAKALEALEEKVN